MSEIGPGSAWCLEMHELLLLGSVVFAKLMAKRGRSICIAILYSYNKLQIPACRPVIQSVGQSDSE